MRSGARRGAAFLDCCYWLNRAGLSWFAAALRLLVHHLGLHRSAEERYADPDKVGYYSFIEIRGIGPVAFRRHDGTLQYRW